MSVRVQFLPQAFDDLKDYAATGNLPLFLKKLLRLEDVGQDAGQPLGGNLVGWRKIVMGDRTWRILFRMNPEETTATILVIGDRDEAACYDEAQRRLAALGQRQPETISLAAALFEISPASRAAKKARRRR